MVCMHTWRWDPANKSEEKTVTNLGKGAKPRNISQYLNGVVRKPSKTSVFCQITGEILFFLLLVNLVNATYAECMQQFGR